MKKLLAESEKSAEVAGSGGGQEFAFAHVA